MSLDRSTYEAWLLDRLEGRLTSEQEQELDAFLLAHPELASEADGLPHVPSGEELFPAKGAMHRNFPPLGAPDAARLDDHLAARLEGDLSAEQEKQLDRYLYEHPEAERDALLMARTKVPSEVMAFEAKADMERHFPPRGLPDEHRLVDFLIAEAEGDLDAEQLTALDRFLRDHPGARREQQLVAAALVKRDALAYPGRNALKKRVVRVVPLWSRLAAAASIALLLSAGWWWLRKAPQARNGGIAQVGPTVPQGTTGHATPVVQAPKAESEAPMPTGEMAERGKVRVATRRSHSSETERASSNGSRHAEQPLPLLEPIRRIGRASIERPALAQVPAEAGDRNITLSGVDASTPIAAVSPAGEGEDLGTFLANKVRQDVLDAPRRTAELDGTDALAMVDKVIGTVTHGQGGMTVQRGGTADLIHLRIGRNFSLSASRGR